ncbi:MaoC family dehydratase [Eubacterium limosum]|uniref:MaoC family dehydratase n=1 Tax=Eubacterium limosum TaxID=1736 RepID=UPI0022E4A717|nr:MaoC family dehydratase [Eubacterium limosum]
MVGKTINEISIGETASYSKTITETDVYLFAGISGDINPAHLNEEVSQKGIFGTRVVHGILTSGLISAVLGVWLPGPGTIYLGQDLLFKKPVKINETITAEVKAIEKDTNKNIMKFETICKNQNQDIVIEGIATVMPPKKEI